MIKAEILCSVTTMDGVETTLSEITINKITVTEDQIVHFNVAVDRSAEMGPWKILEIAKVLFLEEEEDHLIATQIITNNLIIHILEINGQVKEMEVRTGGTGLHTMNMITNQVLIEDLMTWIILTTISLEIVDFMIVALEVAVLSVLA